MRGYRNRHEPAQKTYIIHNDILDISPPHEGRVRRCVRAAARLLHMHRHSHSACTETGTQKQASAREASNKQREKKAKLLSGRGRLEAPFGSTPSRAEI